MRENIRNATVTIGTTPTLVSPELFEGELTAASFVNTSSAGQNITLAWGQQATAGQGVFLYPTGSWSESIEDIFKPSPLAIWGVASAAGATLAVHTRINPRV